MNLENLETKEEISIEELLTQPSPDLEFGQEDFHDVALAKFGKIMRWQEGQNIQSWAESLLEQLVPFVKGLQGSLYHADNRQSYLRFAGGFAIDYEENIQKKYRFGEGLIGQVAKDQSPMILADNQEFASITSMKKIRLKCIIISPLIYNERTVGVIEINFPQKPSDDYFNFLKLVSDTIASNLNALAKEQALAVSFEKIQASEERLQRLAEVTTEGIVFLNEERKIIEFNSAFERIFGYEPNDILGKTLSDFLVTTEISAEELEKRISGDIPIETLGERRDKSTIHLEIQERDITSNNAFFHIISVRDISQRIQAEETLKKTEAELQEAQKVVKLTNIIKKKNKAITSSINYAKRIQDALLPEIATIQEDLPECFIFFRPRDIVSGDFYWYTKQDNKLVIAAVDCTGHGVPGAIMAMAGSVFLKQIVNLQEITSPDEILTQLHLNISKSLKQKETGNKDGMEAAICTIDRETGVVEFAGAKSSLVYVQNQNLHEINGDKMPIGGAWDKYEVNRIFRSTKIHLEPEQPMTCYLFSDGFQDQFGGPQGKKFMRHRLKELFLEIHPHSMDEQKQILDNTMDEWKHNQKQIDDMLVIGFRI